MRKLARNAILFLGMGGAQPGQPDQLGVHLGFLNPSGFPDAMAFTRRSQSGGVHVFETAHSHVPVITWEINFALVSSVCHNIGIKEPSVT